MEESTFTVELEGGSPWGFTLLGGTDHRSPLKIGRITPGGRAAKSGLLAGDYILAINDRSSKDLKHLQAQQTIKKSTQNITLKCTKHLPSITSPLASKPLSFNYPNGNQVTSPVARGPVVKAQPISKPKPPPVSSHARSASMSTPSEGTTTGSSSPHSNTDVYDVKFQGLDTVCIDLSHPMQNDDDVVCQQRQQNLNEQTSISHSKPHPQTHPHSDNLNDWEMVEAPPKTEFDKFLLAAAINQAAQARVRRESGSEHGGGSQTDLTNSSPPRQKPVEEQVEQVHLPQVEATYQFPDIQEATPPDDKEVTRTPSPADDQSESYNQRPIIVEEVQVEQVEQTPYVIPDVTKTTPPKQNQPSKQQQQQPILQKKEEPVPVSIVTKDTGWYKEMFQNFQNVVEETFPGASHEIDESSKHDDENPTYVYDYRGLKVRKDSLPRRQHMTQPPPPKEKVTERAVSPDEEPVYTYDHRGLRVRSGSASRVTDSSPRQLDVVKKAASLRPKSATLAKQYISVRGSTTTEDVLTANKKPTAYKATSYSTGSSRNYWKQKDKDHQVFEDKRRRNSQEYVSHRRSSSSSSDYSSKIYKMHPLLQEGTLDDGYHTRTYSEPVEMSHDQQPALFERIEAKKLQGALTNASTLTALEKEGVPSHLLPAVAQTQQEQKQKTVQGKKDLTPPPGLKAKALFQFDGQNEKELSFKKGDILDLTHTVDGNWLEGTINDKQGIFPRNYVKILTMEEYRELLSPEPRIIDKARAMYSFEGQTERELSFFKGDVISISRKVDANWYEGYHDNKKGIFPVAYVQII